MNYVGTYKMWTLREIEYKLISCRAQSQPCREITSGSIPKIVWKHATETTNVSLPFAVVRIPEQVTLLVVQKRPLRSRELLGRVRSVECVDPVA